MGDIRLLYATDRQQEDAFDDKGLLLIPWSLMNIMRRTRFYQ